MQVVVDGLLTNYESLGSGKPILLLHGWGDSSKGLRSLQKTLSVSARVIALDLPGFGGSESPRSAWGLDEYAQFIAHFLTKIEAPHLSAVFGHSNGGAIAIRGLGRGWLQADKLILLASAGVRDTDKGRLKIMRYATKAGKVLASPLPKRTQQRLRQKLYTRVGSDMLVAEHLQESFKRVVADDVQADAKTLTLPTLIIYGEQDQDTPAVYGMAFHEAIDGSTLEILPDAGHFVHLDQPQRVERSIKDFLV